MDLGGGRSNMYVELAVEHFIKTHNNKEVHPHTIFMNMFYH